LDVHLMIEQPGGTLRTSSGWRDHDDVHVETCPHLHRTIQQIRGAGARPGVALNPHTPFEMILEILEDVDRVLVMTVNPGFGGQQLIPGTLGKLARIRAAIKALDRSIELGVDGGVDVDTVMQVLSQGADVLVAGNSVFGVPGGVEVAIAALRAAATSYHGQAALGH
jgi:ribulose-phosphate 3-epimerase